MNPKIRPGLIHPRGWMKRGDQDLEKLAGLAATPGVQGDLVAIPPELKGTQNLQPQSGHQPTCPPKREPEGAGADAYAL